LAIEIVRIVRNISKKISIKENQLDFLDAGKKYFKS
jgi:hypothetical protein